MPSYTLTDSIHDVWLESFSISSDDLGLTTTPGWSVVKRRLRGGRREGVDVIEVDNGALSFTIIPTRGMGIWKGRYRGDVLGWRSPVDDGPVHPAYVNLMEYGGLGWLYGFDELMVRCGLENNGAPFGEKAVAPDGSELHTTFGLHGKIANIPAHFVAVHIADGPPYEITIEGHVLEARLYGPRIRMVTQIRTTPGSNKLLVRDAFQNRKETASEMQVLYHWNFGAPYLEEGARMLAPIRSVCPRDAAPAGEHTSFDTFTAPQPGYAAQVHFFELLGEGPDGHTLAMLRNHAGDKAVALRFATSQLPAFSLWKYTDAINDGYVTGLEPATNFPNARPFEKRRGRVVTLNPATPYVVETVIEVANTEAAVASLEGEIGRLQAQAAPVIHQKPIEPYCMPSA
jgi:Domain of unknown function (DUF4432)